ncbi:MAG: hypothetical protein ACKV19_17805 [Verrucomicrobiales bacterium]
MFPPRNFEVFNATDYLSAAVEPIPPKGQQTIRYHGLSSNENRGMARAVSLPKEPG